MATFCSFCSKSPAHLRCSACGIAYYCCKECQLTDWKISGDGVGHKAWCGVLYGVQGKDWTIEPVETHGLGIKASRTFKKDERIMIDRLYSHEELETNPRVASDVIKLAGGPTLKEKIITNGIGSKDHRGFFGGICLSISRVNHSCDPNAINYYDLETKTMILHAARNIAKGEEITISYTEFLDPSCTGLKSEHTQHTKILQDQYNIMCPDNCACKKGVALDRLNKSNALEKAMMDAFNAAETEEKQSEVLYGPAMEFIRFHNDSPLRTRFVVRLVLFNIGKSLGIEIKGLKLHELATQLTFPGSKESKTYLGH